MNIRILFDSLSDSEKTELRAFCQDWAFSSSKREAMAYSLTRSEIQLVFEYKSVEAIKSLRNREPKCGLMCGKFVIDHYREYMDFHGRYVAPK